MKKIMVGLVLLGALAWGWQAWGDTFISYNFYTAATTDHTVTITGKPAGNICVFAVTADVVIKWNNSNPDGATVPGGTTMTWTGVEIYKVDLVRTASTAVHIYTW